MFDVIQFIESKRNGDSNKSEDIESFVKQVLNGDVKDYQAASWLMAVYLNGMDKTELLSFTKALAHSGKKVSFPEAQNVVDKHSTGGVGDKTTLVLVPLVASCGVSVAKLSGRGLGFTGGTVDKLEAIPGFRVDMTLESFFDKVNQIGCAIAGHSPDLAPAEAKFYELRDVTATVSSLPLICSSIVSKKIAGGAKSFVFDVKYGSGAFMKDIEDARELAKSLVNLSKELGYGSSALLTSMEEPLGHWVGNSMEVLEAIEVLRGEGPEDTTELCLNLAGEMLYHGSVVTSPDEGYKVALEAISSGKALEKMAELLKMQGANFDVVKEPFRYLKTAPLSAEIKAYDEGVISSIDTRAIGEGIRRLGGGRSQKEDEIDPGAAIEILVKIGDRVEKGQPLMRAFYSDEKKIEGAMMYLDSACSVEQKAQIPKLILERID